MPGYFETEEEQSRRYERETYAGREAIGEGASVACAWCLTWYTPRAMRIHVLQCEKRPDALKGPLT